MADMIHVVAINEKQEKIFRALTQQDGLAKWWTFSAKAEPKEGSIAEFGFYGGQVVFKMKITQLKTPEKVEWECVEGPPEWVNTKLSFQLSTGENGTNLRFIHGNWQSTENMFGGVNYQWALYLLSLKKYVETGTGEPNLE
ncbi:MAG: hypothetical protein HeimC3_09670 [Candidatus Heimdallarchaeota archaeon LC_3]|nr:MAG: hypothetical protein HeimC3_09670 [Candidatus Heimdallarchaeota archaeon LC_3]